MYMQNNSTIIITVSRAVVSSQASPVTEYTRTSCLNQEIFIERDYLREGYLRSGTVRWKRRNQYGGIAKTARRKRIRIIAHCGISHEAKTGNRYRYLAEPTRANVPGLEAIAWIPPPRGPRGSDTTPSAVGPVVQLLHDAAHVLHHRVLRLAAEPMTECEAPRNPPSRSSNHRIPCVKISPLLLLVNSLTMLSWAKLDAAEAKQK